MLNYYYSFGKEKIDTLWLMFRETLLQDWARWAVASVILCSVLFSFHDGK